MEKYFCDYNQSLALKELGFDEPCIAFYWNSGKFYTCAEYRHRIEFHKQNQLGDYNYDSTSAPLKSQVFEWFRDKQNLRSNIMDFIDDVTGIEWDYEIDFIGVDVDENGNYKPLVDYSIDDETRKFKTYKEAESACIDKLIEIVKNK